MDVDPIRRIYDHAAALRAIAAKLPDEQCGLALILELLGEDLQQAVEGLDKSEGPASRESEVDALGDVGHALAAMPPRTDARHLLGTPWTELPPDDAQDAGSPCACGSIA